MFNRLSNLVLFLEFTTMMALSKFYPKAANNNRYPVYYKGVREERK